MEISSDCFGFCCKWLCSILLKKKYVKGYFVSRYHFNFKVLTSWKSLGWGKKQEYWIIGAWFWLSDIFMIVLVVVILIGNLGTCDFIHGTLASYISFLSRTYMSKSLNLQIFLKMKGYLSSNFRRSNHNDSQSLRYKFWSDLFFVS